MPKEQARLRTPGITALELARAITEKGLDVIRAELRAIAKPERSLIVRNVIDQLRAVAWRYENESAARQHDGQPATLGED